MNTRIDELFRLKNITLYYNSLGINEEAKKNYVGFTRSILKERNLKRSQHAKLECYKKVCPFLESRKKFTGFEAFLDIDFKCRINLKSVITPNPDTSSVYNYENNEPFVSTPEQYENSIVSEIKKESKPKLLYFSGGLDSELMAYILLKNDIEFQPVLFQWIDENDNILNAEEISHAFEFCKKYCITPIVENFNVRNFWDTKEFIDLAKELNIGSPHVLTHAKMIIIMNEKFPDYAHYFGGEVRYIMDLLGNQKLDLIFSEKLAYNTTYGYPSGPGGNLSDVYNNLFYGWTNMFIQLQGGGGGGRQNYGSSLGSQAGGGGGGAQGRTMLITKPSATWIKSVRISASAGAGGPGNGSTPSSRNSPSSIAYLYTEQNATGTLWKELWALGGGGAEVSGAGSYPAGYGGASLGSNSLGSPTSETFTELINTSIVNEAGASANNNGGGGAHSHGSGTGTGGTASTTSGGNGANATFASQAILFGAGAFTFGYWGAGGGGGGAPGTSNTGGAGGLGGDSPTSYTVGGNGGDGTAFGNGTNGLGGWGGGGGGAGGGATAGNGSNGQIRLNYWRQ